MKTSIHKLFTGAFIAVGMLQISSLATAQCPPTPDPLEENDTCATAFQLPGFNSNYVGLNVDKTDKDLYTFWVSPFTTVIIDIDFDHSVADIDAILRESSSPACGTGPGLDILTSGTSVTNNEVLTWENPSSFECMQVTLEICVYDNALNGDCNDYDLTVRGTACFGAGNLCDPGTPNSTGVPTEIRWELNIQAAGNMFSTNGPPNQFGYFLVSPYANAAGVPLGSGRFCLGSPFGRYNIYGSNFNSLGRFNAQGDLVNLSGTAPSGTGGLGYLLPVTLPNNLGPIASNGTLFFQLWHREANGGSNFSNGLGVSFP